MTAATQIGNTWLLHRQRKDAAQKVKAADKERVVKSSAEANKTLVLCMDVQSVLLTPKITASPPPPPFTTRGN